MLSELHIRGVGWFIGQRLGRLRRSCSRYFRVWSCMLYHHVWPLPRLSLRHKGRLQCSCNSNKYPSTQRSEWSTKSVDGNRRARVRSGWKICAYPNWITQQALNRRRDASTAVVDEVKATAMSFVHIALAPMHNFCGVVRRFVEVFMDACESAAKAVSTP